MLGRMPRKFDRKIRRKCACGCGRIVPPTTHKTGPRRGQVMRYPRFIPGHGSRDWGRRWSKQIRLHGSPRSVPIGTSIKLDSGYVKIKVKQPNEWMYEHRFVMERKLLRKLRPGEVVHHSNGCRADNCIENLVLLTSSEHARQHHTISSWSVLHQECIICGETSRAHASRGKCTRCYQRAYVPPCRR